MTEYEILKHRADTAADDGTYAWALAEIERLREALQWFCERVERGEVQSRKSYARFKEELARAALKGDE